MSLPCSLNQFHLADFKRLAAEQDLCTCHFTAICTTAALALALGDSEHVLVFSTDDNCVNAYTGALLQSAMW